MTDKENIAWFFESVTPVSGFKLEKLAKCVILIDIVDKRTFALVYNAVKRVKFA